MERQGRVLVIEDLAPWREELSEILGRSGYFVQTAASLAEARERLKNSFYHVLIVDIRLEDTDPSNEDGIKLLRELDEQGLMRAFKVIMLSSHDTGDYVRTAFRDYGVVDFLSRHNFKQQTFLEKVRETFSKHVKINPALTLHWQQFTETEEAVHNLEIDGIRLKRDPTLKSRIALELEDLFCRLFNQADSILARPMTSGQSGTGVLWVQPYYPTGGGRPVVVKFGDFRKIEAEQKNFQEYVKNFVGGGRSTTILDTQRTPHLGGIMYSLLGTEDDRLEDFGSLYQHASIHEIKSVLDRLFLDTCRAWYANVSPLQPLDLTADYQLMFGFTKENLTKAVAELQKYVQMRLVQGKQVLDFKSLTMDRSFQNPVQLLDEPPLVYPTSTCITHGDFTQHNILVDHSGHTWLIDFQSVARGHIFRDMAQLDSVIRFILLAPGEATLKERLQMEEVLGRAQQYHQVAQLAANLPTNNQLLAKAFATVIHLRTMARKISAQNPSDDMRDYYIALFYNAVNMLRFYGLASEQREHALLSASVLFAHLTSRR
jgi:CheY-like chemotaxis protein